MSQDTCSSCSSPIQPDFRFCPFCGNDLNRPVTCKNCGRVNESDSRFCQECGSVLNAAAAGKTKPPSKSKVVDNTTPVLEPPPTSGITIEFPYSTAQSFDFAVAAAEALPGYRRFGDEKRAIYRVTVQPHEMSLLSELLDHLKGWRKRIVYADGQKVTWESVFSFTWCHEKRRASFKPELYCFGYENDWELNVWGCIQARMAFTDNAEWLCWGTWVNDSGDWKFDKERIRHNLEKTLYEFRYCPALQPKLIDDVLAALPDVVNPRRDKDWKFIESWGDEAPNGLRMAVERFGFRETAVMKGVGPNGKGALKTLAKRMNNRLPEVP